MANGTSGTSDRYRYNLASTTKHVEGHEGRGPLAMDATAKGKLW